MSMFKISDMENTVQDKREDSVAIGTWNYLKAGLTTVGVLDDTMDVGEVQSIIVSCILPVTEFTTLNPHNHTARQFILELGRCHATKAVFDVEAFNEQHMKGSICLGALLVPDPYDPEYANQLPVFVLKKHDPLFELSIVNPAAVVRGTKI